MAETWETVKSAGLKQQHRLWLVGLAAEVANGFPRYMPVFVNIGIYHGASMHCLRRGAPGAWLWGVDIKEWGIVRPKLLSANYLWEDSTECHRDFARPIHLLFLDGAQLYEDVKKDIEGWCPKIVVDGLVILNCYDLPAPRWGAKQAWDEWQLRADTEWEPVSAPHPMAAFRRLE